MTTIVKKNIVLQTKYSIGETKLFTLYFEPTTQIYFFRVYWEKNILNNKKILIIVIETNT